MHPSREAIGSRLQEERKRLGLNQDDFASKVGIAKRTLAGYEGGNGDVGAIVMAKAAELGLDVMYVVTGTRLLAAADGLTPLELNLITSLRSLAPSDREHLARMAAALTAMPPPEG